MNKHITQDIKDYAEPSSSYAPKKQTRWEMVKDAMMISVVAIVFGLMLAMGI